MTPAGLPHSEIPGSQVVCTSPRLIAAYHVLPRFPEPRHPPYALSCLTSISSSPRAHSGSHGASPAAGPASCRAPPRALGAEPPRLPCSSLLTAPSCLSQTGLTAGFDSQIASNHKGLHHQGQDAGAHPAEHPFHHPQVRSDLAAAG